MKKVAVVLAMLSVLCFGAVAQATVYSDAIGIANNDGSAIPAATSVTGYVAQVNWINGTGMDPITLDKQLTNNAVATTLTATWGYWHDNSGGNDPVGLINTGLTYFTKGLVTGTGDARIDITGIPFTNWDAAVMTGTMTQHWTLVTGLTGPTWSSLEPRNQGVGGDMLLAVQILSTDPGTWGGGGTNPVPEPAGLGLIGAALLFLKRRRS